MIRTPRYYGQFSLSLGKAHTFFQNSTRLIYRHPIMQTTDSCFLPNGQILIELKSTLLMRTLVYQLCVVTNLWCLFYQLKEDYYYNYYYYYNNYYYYCLANKATHFFIFSATSAEPVKVVWYWLLVRACGLSLQQHFCYRCTDGTCGKRRQLPALQLQ